MIVRYTPRAIGDLIAIADYIKARNRQAAERIETAISMSVDQLSQHPNLGVDRAHLGVRGLGVPRFPYTIYYRVDPEAVVIVHIRDDRRRPLGAADL
ncbi:MAG: type II toxin-antitoxin system RelE/ParE family toxin [Hyphomicrobium sp.]